MAQYLAQSLDDLPDFKTMLSMSGLDFMQKMLVGDLPRPPISGVLDYWLETVEEGRVVFRGTPAFAHTNPLRTVHGGWYGTLMDSCMSCAVMTTLPKGSYYTTLEYKVNITRTIPLGMSVLAEGVVHHAGRSTGVANGTIKGADDGKLYATGSATCLIMKRP